ncbi:matrix metalloproteinase-14 [Plakobranchus ocellatus]|uniref:Matrix metalloproteinase-14 n=1 Tax=Plakobranchus ocellatus TaxID=259542 RepID=A0AAV4A0A2_9GAST|nr:matrix metalloproteinase-14 [Plakobranchus ocellatus]
MILAEGSRRSVTSRPRPTTRRPRPTTRRPRPPTRRTRPTTRRPHITTRRTRPTTRRPRVTTRRTRPTTRRPRVTTRRTRPTTRRPRITTRRTRPTTRRPTTRTTRRPRPTPRSGGCQLRFDAIELVHDGRIYVFRGPHIYQMTAQGPQNRRLIRRVFPGAPNKPGAVVYDRYRRKLYIFKGRRLWRFTGYRKDAGYPKPLPASFRGIRAAFQWTDGGLYLFKGRNYTRWAESLSRHSSGYPRVASRFWRGMPSNIEAGFRAYDGYIYVFKYQRYWRYNSLGRLSPGFPKSTRPVWLNCNRPSRIRTGGNELSYLTQEIRQKPTED